MNPKPKRDLEDGIDVVDGSMGEEVLFIISLVSPVVGVLRRLASAGCPDVAGEFRELEG